MELIKTVWPLIGVLVGWLLSESGKIFSDKRQDKRKLKKLLFFLLELRYYFANELDYEIGLDNYINIMKTKLSEKLGIDKNDPDLNLGVSSWKPFIQNLISKAKADDNKFEYLSENIDKIIIELAEIFPLLAYELSGQHNIKERLNKANNLYSELETISNEIPFDFKQFVNPKLTKDLLSDLDVSIEKIATKIDKSSLKISKEKILKMNTYESDPDVEKQVEEYLEKVTEQLQLK